MLAFVFKCCGVSSTLTEFWREQLVYSFPTRSRTPRGEISVSRRDVMVTLLTLVLQGQGAPDLLFEARIARISIFIPPTHLCYVQVPSNNPSSPTAGAGGAHHF